MFMAYQLQNHAIVLKINIPLMTFETYGQKSKLKLN